MACPIPQGSRKEAQVFLQQNIKNIESFADQTHFDFVMAIQQYQSIESR